jgi:hypothetical protein
MPVRTPLGDNERIQLAFHLDAAIGIARDRALDRRSLGDLEDRLDQYRRLIEADHQLGRWAPRTRGRMRHMPASQGAQPTA